MIYNLFLEIPILCFESYKMEHILLHVECEAMHFEHRLVYETPHAVCFEYETFEIPLLCNIPSHDVRMACNIFCDSGWM